MKKLLTPIDSSFLIRFFHLHCFIHIYRVINAKDASDYFSAPRFQLFKTIKSWYQNKQTTNYLFKNILFSYQNQIIVGSIITLIFASCNLFVPQLIKSFLHFMREHHVNKSEVTSAQGFIQMFFIVQFLRIIFGQHSKRLFFQLAVQIQSSLCKKIIRKALTFQRCFRDRIHKSQIMQLQNVDLKLIFTMFKNMYLLVEAPFTIFVAIVMLFRQNHVYGFIGIYWFVIAFLLQRELDSRMINCNQTKLKLIDQRSKINYELFGRIKQAKLIHHEDLIVQKNNDLFIQQNHDHQIFYHYSTLYDITLLILPIIVVVTISLFDMDNQNHITVQQVYIMLELLGICYNPMKAFRTIRISFHDGFHSLRRLQKFFDYPDQVLSTLIVYTDGIEQSSLIIKQRTACVHPNSQFQLQINHHIQLKKGDRLIVIGKKGQGKTSFMRMILGQMKKIQGAVFINSKVATSLQTHFFRKGSILQNILVSDDSQQSLAQTKQFYKKQLQTKQQKYKHQNKQNKQIQQLKQRLELIDQKISSYKQKIKLAEILYKQFGLQHDFSNKQGINTLIDQKLLTKKQMKKISLIRLFCADPQIYILQSPFSVLDKTTAMAVQKRLRQKQQKQRTIIMSQVTLQYVKEDDKILILQKGQSIQYDSFRKLLNNKESQISLYFKSKQDLQAIKEPDSARKILGKFKNRLKSAMSQTFSDDSQEEVKFGKKEKAPNSPYLKYRSMSLAYNLKKKKIQQNTKPSEQQYSFWKYFFFYLKCFSIIEILFILVIIAVAQFLHIFIHYYIGHLDEQQQDNPYLEFQNILILQFILTMALALIIYFEGEVSSLISIIQGNILYQKSIKSIVKKPINWFYQQFSVKLADKFNHDYEQIFIACHSLLGIYKNVIILLITINIISVGRSNMFATFFIVCVIYFSIGNILRKVQHKVVKHFYQYKYEFVKIFQQCLDGGATIQIFDGVDDVLRRTNKIYKQIAAYKLAQSYTAYGQQLFCDFVSLILLVMALLYGLQIKLEGSKYNIALVGTTIHLLLNVSQVLKNIVKLTINFQTFFNLNIAPFLQTAYEKQLSNKAQQTYETHQVQQTQKKRKKTLISYEIHFQDVGLVNQEQKIILLKHQRINLKIKQNSKIVIYEANQKARAKLVQALTKNSQDILKQSPQKVGTIKIGQIDIKNISDQDMLDYVSTLMSSNFLWTNATLRQNITWRRGQLLPQEQRQAIRLARRLNLDLDLKDFQELKLNCIITFEDVQTNSQLSKKIAFLRTLIRKPRIIILKNISSYIGEIPILQLIKDTQDEYNCTIIKITGNCQQIPGMNRAIYMQNLKVIQNDKLTKFQGDQSTHIGRLLKQVNLQNYEHINKAVFSPRKLSKKDGSKSSVYNYSINGSYTQRSNFTQYSI